MTEDDRVWGVRKLLSDFVRSPSLKHIRDPHSLARLAQEIVKEIDQGNAIWRKWDGQRELVLKSALPCWIPTDDMRDFLNRMPGPPLTTTDVAQRLNAFAEEPFESYPKEALRAGCLSLYEKEKAKGTGLPAIIGLLRDHVEREESRLRAEHALRLKQRREDDRIAREQRLLSGADCGWTQLQKSPNWFCRKNGRTYRLSPSKNGMWHLFRVGSTSEDEEGALLGKYQHRRDATKAIREMAYRPEPRCSKEEA